MEDGGLGQMMLLGPPLSPNKDQRPGKGEEGPPLFLILESRGLLLSLFREGLRLPYILYPPTPI